MYMNVLGKAEDCVVKIRNTVSTRRTVAHGDKGAYGAEAGQHPRLNGERDLWRERAQREP